VATEKITIRLVLDSSGYKKGASQASSATDQIKSKVGQTNSTFGKLGGTLGKIGPALVGVFAAKKVFAAAGAAIGRAEAMSTAYAITEKVIQQTGGAANVTADQIKRLSKEQALLTGIDKELITQSNNVLLTFKNVRNEVGANNDVFNQASGLVLDMATVMGTDAKSGAIQLGKALNDPVMGVTALNRVGITFTEQQKDQIKVLTESGDVLGAQRIILAELEGQLGGTAAAAADTTAKIKVAFQEAQESIGAGLLEALDEVAPEFTEIADAVSNLGPLFTATFKTIIAAIKPVVGFLVLVSDGILSINALLGDDTAKAALRAKEAIDFVNKAAEEGSSIYDAFANGLLHMAKNGALSADTLTDLAIEAGVSEAAMAGALAVNLEFARSNGFAADQIEVLEDALLRSALAGAETGLTYEELIEKYDLTDAAARNAATAIDDTGEAADGAEGPVDEFGNALEAAEEEAKAAEAALKDYLDTLAGLVNPALKAVNALGDLQEATAKVSELEKAGKTDTDEYRLAQLELAAQVFETESALREFDGGNVEQSVAAIAVALGISEQAAIDLLTELGLIDGKTVRSVVTTEFLTTGSSAAISAGVAGIGSGSATFGGIRAEGGPVTAGMPFLVGEKGPEIFIPDHAGQIVSNADALKGAGTPVETEGGMGGDVNLTINNPIAENVEDDTRKGIQTAGFLRGAN
jgi:hypothetical protein